MSVKDIVSQNILKSFLPSIIKGYTEGVYSDTSENCKLNRVGQKYSKSEKETSKEEIKYKDVSVDPYSYVEKNKNELCDFWNKFLSSSRESLMDYRTINYKGINKYLRGELINSPSKIFYKKIAEDIERAFKSDKSKLNDNLILYRGLSLSDDKDIYKGLKIGDQISDKAFVSTSLDKDTATGFHLSMSEKKDLKINNYIFKIFYKKGQKAIPLIDSDDVFEELASEYEILLPNDTKFNIKNKYGDVIELEIID